MPVASSERENRFDALYHAHHRHVLAYCLRRSEWADAHDATAEVFVVVWRRLNELPPDDELLRWLYGVAAKVLANQRRSIGRLARLVRRVGGLGASFDPGPEVQLVQRADRQEVVQALGRLRPADQEVLRLYAWEDLTHEEIATLLGSSRAAIAQRIHRAYKRLGEQMARSRMLENGAMTPRHRQAGGEQ